MSIIIKFQIIQTVMLMSEKIIIYNAKKCQYIFTLGTILTVCQQCGQYILPLVKSKI